MDAPRKTNKDLIHRALKRSAEQLAAEIDLKASQRPENAVEIDHDTKGVLGSPEIVAEIFRKIREADVVCCDVSLAARGKDNDQRHHINSNVAIELGYALGERGFTVLLQVMNTHYGAPANLPFDLSNRRHPTTYELGPTASKAEVDKAVVSLSQDLKPILRTYLEALDSKGTAIREPHIPVERTHMAPAFWSIDEAVATFNIDGTEFYCQLSKLFAFRILPVERQEPLTARDCKDSVANCPPPGPAGGYYTEPNQWGAISFSGDPQRQHMDSAVQLFKNREIWCFSDLPVWQHGGDDDDNARWFFSDDPITRYIPPALENAMQLSAGIIRGRRRLQMILGPLDNTFIRERNNPGPRGLHRIHADYVQRDWLFEDPVDAAHLTLEFTERVYAEAGLSLR